MSEESPINRSDHWFVGEKKFLDYTVVNDNAAGIDITGWSLGWDLYERAEDSTALLTKTTSSGISQTGTSVCRVQIDPADTLAMAPKTYYFELWRLDPSYKQALAFGDARLIS